MNAAPKNRLALFLTVTGSIIAMYTLLTLLSSLVVHTSNAIPWVWLPAGLAVAAVVVLGARATALGIWLGALLALLFDRTLVNLQLNDLLVASLLAGGAVFQAFVAGWLHARFAVFWDPRRHPRSRLVWFSLKLLLASAGCGSIGAAIGIAVHLADRTLQLSTAGPAFGAFWLGNTLGVLVLAPVMIMLGQRLHGVSKPRQIVVRVVDIGLVLSISLFFLLWNAESIRISNEFEDDAAAAALVLRTTVGQYQHDVEVLQALVMASDQKISRERFHTFVQLHMQDPSQTPGLQALVWAQVVPAARRSEVEAAFQREGFPGLMINERTADAQIVPAGARNEYVVATYNEPLESNRSAMGYDFASEPIRRAALEQARDTAKAIATTPTKLITGLAPGFLIFWPVYAAGAPTDTIRDRRANIVGYVVGAFRVQDLVSTAMPARVFPDLDAYLFETDGSTDLPFYIHSAPSRAVALASENAAPPVRLFASVHATTTLDVAGRPWQVIITPSPAFSAKHRSMIPWAALVIGLMISTWIARTFGQRQQDSEALQHSEHRFRTLIEKSANAIVLLDDKGTVIYNSPNYAQIMGYDSASRIGANSLETVYPEDVPAVARTLREVIETPGLSRTTLFRARHVDGSWLWLESTGTNLRDDRAVGAIVVNIRDVTASKLAETALRENELRLRTILQTALDGFWIVDPQQRFLDVNEAYCTMSGYSRAEILAMQISDLEAIELPVKTMARIQQIVTTGAAQFETRHRRKDGSVFDVDVSVRYIENGHGQLVCFCRDITERKRRAEEIQRLNSELELRVAERTADLSRVNADLHRALQAKDAFLATMSHELRTPLNGILAYAELLGELDAGPLNERQRRSVQQIDTSGHHLLSLINDILDLSKIEAEHMEMHFELHSVSDICNASLRFVKELALKKGLRLSFACNNDLAMMEIDEKRLKQMLVNLLSNAVKFTPAGGLIRLEAHADSAEGVVRFIVQDTGIGIAPEDVGQLFQPFTQLDSGLTRQHEGTGLGLALVKRLVDLLGGSITLASAGLGKGSCFTLTLPWHQPLVRSNTDSNQPQLPGEKITNALVIEDSPSAAGQIAGYLRELGIHVMILPQAEDLTDHAISLRPDVIFLDLILPGASGWDVLVRLKSDPLTCDVPVVVVSVVDDPARGLAAGAAAYLLKPLTRNALTIALKQVSARTQAITHALILDPRAAGERHAAHAAQPAATILIADDNETTISVLSDYLRERNYRVIVTRNGQEAIAMAVELQPDLILMDVQMPILDGLEATRRLRTLAGFATIPIVALTALAMPGDRERCLEAGANEYLSKPISLRGLAELMRQLLHA